MEPVSGRVAILSLTTRDAVVDDYVFSLLKELNRCAASTVVICPHTVETASLKKLGDYAKELYVFDPSVGMGQEDRNAVYGILATCSEALFVEDSVFGPFFPLEDTLRQTEAWPVDFWGLVADFDHLDAEGNLCPRQLQPWFVALRASVLQDERFHTYCQQGPFPSLKALLPRLTQWGYTWRETADVSYAAGRSADENCDPSLYLSYDLIKKKKIPFLPIGALTNRDYLPGGSEVPRLTYDYIQAHCPKRIPEIWQNLLRHHSIVDLLEALQLEWTIPKQGVPVPQAAGTALVIAHLFYPELLEDAMEHLLDLPETVDVCIVSSSDTVLQAAETIVRKNQRKNFSFRLKNNRGRDFSALLVACKDLLLRYRYLCFIHDKKSHAHIPVPAGRTWFHQLWSCMLQDCHHVQSILHLFEENEQLGLLVPPEPLHSYFKIYAGQYWHANYAITKGLLSDLDVHVPVSEDKPPFTISTAFWCKTEALRPLFERDFTYDFFPDEPMAADGTICHALERCFGYVAQSQGFYTAFVMSERFATERSMMLRSYLFDAVPVLMKLNLIRYQEGGYVLGDEASLQKLPRFLEFCQKHHTLYVYGAGPYGASCCWLAEHYGIRIQAVVVSDPKDNPKEVNGYPVIAVDDIRGQHEAGVVLALQPKNYPALTKLLQEYGITDVFPYAL